MVRRLSTWVLAALVVVGVTACQAPPGAAPTAAGVVVPATVLGKDPKQAKDELRALGFAKFKVEAVSGKAVMVEANWRVVAVTSMGQAVPVTTELVLSVDRPQPTSTTTTATTTTTTTVRTTAVPPPPPPRAEPPPVPEPEVTRPGKPAGAYYANCAEAKRAGAAPLRRGEPGYRSGLDRDGDGVACEK